MVQQFGSWLDGRLHDKGYKRLYAAFEACGCEQCRDGLVLLTSSSQSNLWDLTCKKDDLKVEPP